jgi:hypothetical protein
MENATDIDDLLALLCAEGFQIDTDERHAIHLLAGNILSSFDSYQDAWRPIFIQHIECLVVKNVAARSLFVNSCNDWLNYKPEPNVDDPWQTPGPTPTEPPFQNLMFLLKTNAQTICLAIGIAVVLTFGVVVTFRFVMPPAAQEAQSPIIPPVTRLEPEQRQEVETQPSSVSSAIDLVIKESLALNRAPTLRELHTKKAFGDYNLSQVSRASSFPIDQPLAMDDPKIATAVVSTAVRLSTGTTVQISRSQIAQLLVPEEVINNRAERMIRDLLEQPSLGQGQEVATIKSIKYPSEFWVRLKNFVPKEISKLRISFETPQQQDIAELAEALHFFELYEGEEVYNVSDIEISQADLARSFSAYSYSIGQGVVITDADWLPLEIRRTSPPLRGSLRHFHLFLALGMLLLVIGFWIWRATRMQGWLDRNRAGHSRILDLRGEAALDLSVAFPGARVIARSLLKPFQSRIAIDVRRSVINTVRAGGLLTFFHTPKSGTLSTLVLIDKRALADHGAKRALDWCRRLQAENVPIVAYTFEGGPDWLHPISGGRSQQLEEVASRHAGDKLLIFGNAKDFVDPGTRRLGAWKHALHLFPYRTLLTGVPRNEWASPEDLVYREGGLLTYPLTENGLISALAAFEVETHKPDYASRASSGQWIWPSCLALEPGRWLSEVAPDQSVIKVLISQLYGWLGSQGVRWLSACAVYPVLDWDLTLQFGAKLGAGPHGLVTEDRLLRLSELPWMRHGQLPDWLRGALIEEIKHEDKTLILVFLRELFRGLEEGNTTSGLHLSFAARFGRDAAKDERFVAFATSPPKGANSSAIEASRALARLLRPTLMQRLTNPQTLLDLCLGLVIVAVTWKLAPRLGHYGVTGEFWWVPILAAFICFGLLQAGAAIFRAIGNARGPDQKKPNQIMPVKEQLGSQQEDISENSVRSDKSTSTIVDETQTAAIKNEGIVKDAVAIKSQRTSWGNEQQIRVFIASANADLSILSDIIKGIDSLENVSVWRDTNVSGGQDYALKIEDHLQSSDVVVVFWTNRSVNSEWVLMEANMAKTQQKLLPCQLGSDFNIPLPFHTLHTIQLNEADLPSKSWINRPLVEIERAIMQIGEPNRLKRLSMRID